MYGDKSMKQTAIFVTVKKFKAGKNTEASQPKKTTRISNQIAADIANNEEDHWVSIKKLALAHGLSVRTI